MMEKLAGELLTLGQNPRWAARTEAGKSRGVCPQRGPWPHPELRGRSVLGPH